MLEALLLLLLAASWLYWLAAWLVACLFFRSSRRDLPDYTPAASILKPVRGLDAQALENYASFCRQNYPDYELLFGCANPEDPAVHLIRQLQRDYPHVPIRLVSGPALGPNRKAGLLHRLASEARHDILIVSDSDMRVTPDYLRRVVAPLANPDTGLVTCCYRAQAPRTLAARLEALHIGAIFMPSVIIANWLFKFGFAMGSTAALRRRDLDRLGGFQAITGYLADDYQLGARIAGLGLRVHLSDYVVATVLGRTGFVEEWHREVRWTRCARVSRPWCYPGLFISFTIPLALLLLLLSGFAAAGWQALVVSLAVRWLVAYLVCGYAGDGESRRFLAWLPLRDLLSALVWLAGGLGRHIIWRGDRFLLRPDGRMEPASPATPGWLAELRAWRP